MAEPASSTRRKRVATRLALQAEAPALSSAALDVLADMYALPALEGDGGVPVPLQQTTRIPIPEGAELHRLIRSGGFTRTLEIGFAYGFSTVWMLDALAGASGSVHVAVDPKERTHWGGVGLRQVERLALPEGAFSWREQTAVGALSRLVDEGARFEFVFIDGSHRFDDVIVDSCLADQLLAVGGLLVFDDMWMQSVRAAASFLRTNRAYRQVPQQVRNMAVFQKLAEDDRPWNHYRPFRTSFPPIDLNRRDGSGGI